jgi:hypothetical protein
MSLYENINKPERKPENQDQSLSQLSTLKLTRRCRRKKAASNLNQRQRNEAHW